MKIFLIFATLVGFIVSAQAQTTVNITVNGQAYDVTYRTGVTFAAYESTVDDATWWTGDPADGATASAFATAMNSAHSLGNIRFGYNTRNILSTDVVDYAISSGGDLAAVSSSADYAISAVAVPAPLPILGILPVVGFLKRMRRRQKAS